LRYSRANLRSNLPDLEFSPQSLTILSDLRDPWAKSDSGYPNSHDPRYSRATLPDSGEFQISNLKSQIKGSVVDQ
jgi:hypothetical protein